MNEEIAHKLLIAAQQPNPTGATVQLIIMMVLMFVIMYLVLIRPQQKRQKEHQALIQNLKVGDRVVTSSGIYGVIVNLKDRTLTLRTGDSKIEILRSSVVQVVDRKSEIDDQKSTNNATTS